MQQRQLRLGDVIDDYCPRERRVTNHAVVAMIGDAVRLTRCTTCEAEHDYKQARVPRQRRKTETPAALYAQVASGAPKRVTHEPAGAPAPSAADTGAIEPNGIEPGSMEAAAPAQPPEDGAEPGNAEALGQEPQEPEEEEGPAHRRLIRAALPRIEGHQPPPRPIPEFTVRQPGGRQNRFRPRHQRGGGPGQPGQFFPGNRSNGGGFNGPPRGGGGRPPQGHMSSRPPRHHGGPKRGK